MGQGIFHLSIIDKFFKLGKDLGYFPIKEFALMNILKETTEERFDLVWIKNREVEYAFEFDTNTNSVKKSLNKLKKIKEPPINKYCFLIRKSPSGDILDLKGLCNNDTLFSKLASKLIIGY